MERFTKYFGGDYTRYWYIGFGVIIIIMMISMWNDRSVQEYDLYIYNSDGSLKSVTQVPRGYYEMERLDLPVTKMFVPKKTL